MNLPTLTYEHRFSSGREITLFVTRKEATTPKVEGSIQYCDLTREEKSEFQKWITITIAHISNALTAEEMSAWRVP